MPYKDKERRKAYNKSYGMKWYHKHREKILQRTKAHVQRHREKWWEFKSTLKCEKCGFSHPAAIDFHHPEARGDTKVSKYISHKQWKRAYEEAAKCQILCANCHRILHYEEKKS